MEKEDGAKRSTNKEVCWVTTWLQMTLISLVCYRWHSLVLPQMTLIEMILISPVLPAMWERLREGLARGWINTGELFRRQRLKDLFWLSWCGSQITEWIGGMWLFWTTAPIHMNGLPWRLPITEDSPFSWTETKACYQQHMTEYWGSSEVLWLLSTLLCFWTC